MHLAYFHYLCEGDTALNHACQFARAAETLGHRIDVFPLNSAKVSSVGEANSERLVRLMRMLKSRLSFFLHEPKKLVWNGPYFARSLSILRSVKPDAVLVRGQSLTISAILAARVLRIPVVLELNAPALEGRLYLDQYLHLPLVPDWIEKWQLQCVDKVTVVSTALRDFLAERHQMPVEKFAVVPNGVDVSEFHPRVAPDSLVSTKLNQATTIGFVGSFKRWHGMDLLSRSMLEIGRSHPEVVFLLVGDGPCLPETKSQVASLGSRVVFTGSVPHHRVPRLVAMLDVAVLPETAFYCSPLKIVEWMAAGRAIVAPSYEPIQDLIEDGVSGSLFLPGRQADLRKSIVELIDNPARRLSLGRKAAERAGRSLSWTENAAKVLSACEDAILSKSL